MILAEPLQLERGERSYGAPQGRGRRRTDQAARFPWFRGHWPLHRAHSPPESARGHHTRPTWPPKLAWRQLATGQAVVSYFQFSGIAHQAGSPAVNHP